MTTWTKELPKESGFYWYRANTNSEAHIAEFNSKSQVFVFCGDDRLFGPGITELVGEFWPVRLLPPDEARQAWSESEQVTADMRQYLESLAHKGHIHVIDPAKPPYIVKIDPNQTNA